MDADCARACSAQAPAKAAASAVRVDVLPPPWRARMSAASPPNAPSCRASLPRQGQLAVPAFVGPVIAHSRVTLSIADAYRRPIGRMESCPWWGEIASPVHPVAFGRIVHVSNLSPPPGPRATRTIGRASDRKGREEAADARPSDAAFGCRLRPPNGNLRSNRPVLRRRPNRRL